MIRKPNIVMTGATGFLGSSLAASVLQQGGSVVAITRKDSNGERTRSAVHQASLGFGYSLSVEDEKRLFVIESSLEDLPKLDQCCLQYPDFTFWHCAADMRYNNIPIEESLSTNLIQSSKLYRYFATKPNCKRFYLVSTAYTAGFDVQDVKEEIHFHPRLINYYQISKWAAELSLALDCQRQPLPVTIFRPSIICGHDETGWHGKSRFGLYGVLGAIAVATKSESRSLALNIREDASPNFIPINRLVEHALLLDAEIDTQAQLEIVHSAAASNLLISEIEPLVRKLWDINILFTEPNDRRSERVNAAFASNLPFLNHFWRFEQTTLPRLLQDRYKPFHMSTEIMSFLIEKFYMPKMQPLAV